MTLTQMLLSRSVRLAVSPSSDCVLCPFVSVFWFSRVQLTSCASLVSVLVCFLCGLMLQSVYVHLCEYLRALIFSSCRFVCLWWSWCVVSVSLFSPTSLPKQPHKCLCFFLHFPLSMSLSSLFQASGGARCNDND